MSTRKLGNAGFFVVMAAVTFVVGFVQSAQSQEWLIAFGDASPSCYRGTAVPSPDSNGHYWNAVDSGAFFPVLTNTLGHASSLEFGFLTAGNNDSYNGPAGDTSVCTPPSACVSNVVINAGALGDLGYNYGVFHYYNDSELEFQGMDPTHQYSLTFFGSHEYNSDTATVFSVATDATFSTITASTTLTIGATNGVFNESNVAVLSGISPTASGDMFVKFTGQTVSTFGYLNALKIVDLSGTNVAASVNPTNEVLVAMGNATANNGVNIPSPDPNGHYWNGNAQNAYLGGLTNAAGQRTGLNLGPLASNGNDAYNGPAGPVPPGTPSSVIINAAALGDLGYNYGVFHYFVESAFEIDGADPSKSYRLTFFGSHQYNGDTETVYTVCSDAAFTTVIGSAKLYVGSTGAGWNQSNVATIGPISPSSGGYFYIKFAGQTTLADGYLNAFSILDLSTNVIVQPPPVAQTMLLDFGDNESYRSTNTVSPDSLGHYWNDLGPELIDNPLVLTNAAGVAMGITFMFDGTNPAYTNGASGFGVDSYNGPAGPTDGGIPGSIGNCVFNPSALGYLGQTNAVYDFFVNAHCQFHNMNPAHQYGLTFFGSHKYNIDNTTVYSMYSDATYGTTLSSASLLVGAGSGNNQGTVATIGPIYPNLDGSMYLAFKGSAGNLGYLNCMQIVDLTGGGGPPPPNPFVTWQSNYFTSAELSNPAYSGPNADPLGKGISNTNQFLAGFNPTNSAAYPHIISITTSNTANLVIKYLGASGDNTYSPGFASRTNVLDFAIVNPNGSYTNDFVSTGQTNILNGGNGLGTVASFIQTNGATGNSGYYRVRVLLP